MLKNYLKVALRNLRRYKTYSFINIFGLAVGIACCLLILLWIQDELSYDKFHKNADRIYRVSAEFNYAGRPDHFAHTPAPLAPALCNEFPEVIGAVRFAGGWRELIAYGDKQFWVRRFVRADPNIFDVFTFPLAKGDPQKALKELYSIVITEEMAQKFFGDEDPLGKILNVGTEGREDYKITGVLKNVPSNSQLQFDCLVSFSHQRGNIGWGAWNYNTYILLHPNSPPHEIETKFPDFIGKYMGEKRKANTKLHLQPLTKIHLRSKLRNDLATNRDIAHIYIFSGIALLILIIACINFMNLSTARSAIRGKEVGMRKVVGAHRSQLIKQFLGESLLLSFIALLLALVLVEIFLPIFNALADKILVFRYFDNFSLLVSLVGIVLFTGVVAGSYPAFFISASRPINVLSGGRAYVPTSIVRRIFVVAQFAISIIFIACTILIHNQLGYIKDKNLGYDKDHIAVIPLFYQDVSPKYRLYKDAILQNKTILVATATSFLPSEKCYYQDVWWEGMAVDDYDYIDWINVDHDFLETLDIELTLGRDFSREFISDVEGAYILNESAVKNIGWENPIGKQFKIVKKGTVIGVVKDFHYKSLHNKIEPMALYIYPEGFYYLLVRFRPDNVSNSIEFLRNKWKQFFPGRPFEYSFLDADFDRMYKTEAQLGKIFNHIAALAIFIACLGLFGLASFTSERRTKEIGIRKVLGASVSSIVQLLSKEFIKWVVIANLIAWPVAYYAMSKWLQNFAYRINIVWWAFVLAGVLALVISLLAVSYQAIKAATANPVDALRYE